MEKHKLLNIKILGLAFPLIFLTRSVGSFELSVYMLLSIVFGIGTILKYGLKINGKVSIEEFCGIILILMMLLSAFYSYDAGRSVSKFIKYLFLIIIFIFLKRIFEEKRESINIFFKYVSISLSVYLLYLMYCYLIIGGKMVIGMDTVHYGTSGKNSLALVLVCILPFKIVTYLRNFRFSKGNVIQYVCDIVMVVGLILLQSRGALIAIFISIVLILIEEKKGYQIRKVTLISGIVVFGFIFLAPDTLKLQIFERLLSIFAVIDKNIIVSEGAGSTGIRKALIKIAFEKFKQAPFLGNGFGSFIYLNSWKYTGPHNDYLLYLSELGVIGFIVYCSIIFCFIAEARKSYKHTNGTTQLGIMGVMIALAIFSFFMNISDSVLVWTILALISATSIHKGEKNV